jgi:pyridoxal phosphate enzyme (YggS family)
MTAVAGDDARREELTAALARVEGRISAACASAGRPREDVTLIVVTKFFPASDVHLLAELGVKHVGENRHQEGVAKRQECADLDLCWHFVGGLQSNKAAAVGGWADVVHSLDRARLLPGLARAAQERGTTLDVLVQVSLDEEQAATGRSGVPADEAVQLAAEAAGSDGVQLRGVMGVAPLGGDDRASFALLGRVLAAVQERVPAATWMSAGMSGDLEQAVGAGATHVRIGSAVLGNRPAHR